ncbi:dihydroneopterin aldolase [Leadbetterella byssophila]|uniref:dihydroneopterin aldolase n=1 Tax=Leadbetterella byssophila TaxID=316068 RepID=UPI0039A2C247
MGKISLEGMEFFAHHGVWDEEQKVGNRYIIDLHIEADLEKSGVTDHLEDTLDYGKIYGIVAEEMRVSSRLLENIGHRVLSRLRAEFPEAGKMTIEVSKCNPPVGGIVKRSKITLENH